MTYIRWVLRSLMVYSMVTSIYSIEHDPLIFNPHNLEIYNNSNESDCQPCAIACPAESEAEKDCERIDYHLKSLFIKQVVATFQQQNAATRMKCNHPFEMAVLLHSRKGGELVEFGFEVYFEKSEFQSEQLVSEDYYKFSDVGDGESMLERMAAWKRNYLAVPWSRRKSTIQKWGFLWLSEIEVRYNFSSRMMISLKYKVRPIKPDQLKLTCYNHDLYGVWYNMYEELNTHYLRQHMTFKTVKLPEGSCRPHNGADKCVKQHNLVLPYHFQASSPDTISCSNMTTIPLWNEIPDAFMDRLQMFLIAIAQVLVKNERELFVLPGVLGQLTLPSIANDKPVKIYLNDEERKVPVPKIIYKLIRYRSHKCDEKKGELCWYDVLIVIHNYTTFTKDERLCPTDMCETWGWSSIQYLNSSNPGEGKFPFVYCCELTGVTAKLIGFSLGKTLNDHLSLEFVVAYNHDSGRYESWNILNDVLLEFKKLVDAK